MTRYSDGSLCFFSSGDSKDVLLQITSPTRPGAVPPESIRANAVEVLPSPESGALVLHVFGREQDSPHLPFDVTEILLLPRVYLENRTRLK
jgi:hypothetical protein